MHADGRRQLRCESDVGAPVGRGAYADVLRAVRRADGLAVAMKCFRRRAGVAPRAQAASYHNELRVLASLEDASGRWVVRALDAGAVDGGATPAIVFALARMSLRAYMAAQRPGLAVRASVVEQLVRAVRCLHRQRVAHRDIKPDNLLLFGRGTLRLSDFGLARAVGEGERSRTVCGSPMYMAAELAAADDGRGGGGYDPLPADVWSVGCVVYEVLHDRPPFAGRTLGALMLNVRRARLNPLRPGLHRLYRRMLAQSVAADPSQRATADALCIPRYVAG